MSTESELELKIQALDHEQFERLVFDLVEAENPDANRLRPPDAGADTLVLGSGSQATSVWQAKHYTRTIAWTECERSLLDALDRYAPRTLTFVFAKDLTEGQLKSFEMRLRAVGALRGAEVSYWGLSNVRTRLQRHPRIRINYLGHDQQVLLDIAAGKVSPDPLVRAMNVEEELGAADPGFEYEVELTRRELPEPELTAGDTVSMTFKDGQRTLRVGMRRRKEADGPAAVWGFTDDQRGEDARHAAMLATARGEPEVAIESGFVVALHHAPRMMRDAFEETPPEDRRGRFVFKPGPGIPVGISIHLPGGKANSRELTVYPFPPADYAPVGGRLDRAYVGLDGALLLFFGYRFFDDVGNRGQIFFVPLLELGESARENVEALRTCMDLRVAKDVKFSGTIFPPEAVRPGAGRFHIPDERLKQLGALRAVYEGVVSVEEQLGVDLPVHAPPITAGEAQELGTVLAILEDGNVPIRFQEASGQAQPAFADAEEERLRNHPAFVFTATGTVFGTGIQLGTALGTLPDVRVLQIPKLTIAPNPTVTLKVFARDPDKEVMCRLLEEGEEPPPDAIHAPEQPRA